MPHRRIVTHWGWTADGMGTTKRSRRRPAKVGRYVRSEEFQRLQRRCIDLEKLLDGRPRPHHDPDNEIAWSAQWKSFYDAGHKCATEVAKQLHELIETQLLRSTSGTIEVDPTVLLDITRRLEEI
jgi:hypothetical protein